MDYQHYTSEDFALDPYFRKWILQPTVESNLFWEAWLGKHPQKAVLLQEAKAIIHALPLKSRKLDSEEVDGIWLEIEGQIGLKPDTSPPEIPIIPLSPAAVMYSKNSPLPLANYQSNKWDYQQMGRLLAAASIVLALIASFLLGQPRTVAEPELVWVTKKNPWGQRSTIYLSDGTQVQLNAGSKITYPKDFSTTERLLQLQGEAFFEVKKDQSRPFRVVSAGLVTEALGTSFNIRAYDSTQVEVALVTGKVKVTDNKKAKLILTPGQGAIRQIGFPLDKFLFDTESTLAWKEGKLFLQNADEEEVFTLLEHWYGVKIIANNQPNKRWNYTASYQKKSLEHILTSMAFVMDFSFEIQQKRVLITYH